MHLYHEIHYCDPCRPQKLILQISYKPFNKCSHIFTHWPQEPYIGVNGFVIIGPRNGLVPIHFLNQSWLLTEKKLRTKLRYNSCLILRIWLRKIEIKLSSVFSCHISPGLNVFSLNSWRLVTNPQRCFQKVVVRRSCTMQYILVRYAHFCISLISNWGKLLCFLNQNFKNISSCIIL